MALFNNSTLCSCIGSPLVCSSMKLN